MLLDEVEKYILCGLNGVNGCIVVMVKNFEYMLDGLLVLFVFFGVIKKCVIIDMNDIYRDQKFSICNDRGFVFDKGCEQCGWVLFLDILGSNVGLCNVICIGEGVVVFFDGIYCIFVKEYQVYFKDSVLFDVKYMGSIIEVKFIFFSCEIS